MRRRRKYNIKMHPQETVCEDVDCIRLAQDREPETGFCEHVIETRVPKKRGIF